MLIRNLSSLGFLAIATRTITTLFNGPVVGALMAKWFDLRMDTVLPRADVSHDLLMLRYQVDDLMMQIDSRRPRARVEEPGHRDPEPFAP